MRTARYCMLSIITMVLLVFNVVADEFAPLRLKWDLPEQYAKMEGDLLIVDIPRDKHGASAMATAIVPNDRIEGLKRFSFSIEASAENIAKPSKSYLGIKSQLHWRDAKTGADNWPNTRPRAGSFPRTVLKTYVDFMGATPGFAEIQLGLQETSGKIAFDLSTLKLSRDYAFVTENPNRIVSYPERVKNDCRRRGVMLPGSAPVEDDFITLKEWGVNLVRYQMIRNWNKNRDNRDIGEFNLWLDGKLDILEKTVIPLARKYGQKVVVDLHVPPGGRLEGGDMAMFHEKEYAEAFVACWKRIAARFRGNSDIIYGYDLINEPHQIEPGGCGYWEVQKLAALAVREIDPETTIIIESNGWDGPPTFSYLGVLDIDNVIYQVHMYLPIEYTHQKVSNPNMEARAYPDAKKGLDIGQLRNYLKPVREFEKRHKAKIYVGEFSAICWAEGADRYIADCITIFNEYGWDWTYHAFREWPGWSVEHEGEPSREFRPSADNPRKRALLEGFKQK